MISSRPPVSADAVLDLLTPGADVIVLLANGEPTTVLDAIEAGADRLEGVRIHQMHALHDRLYMHGAYGDRLRHVSYFLSHITRPAYWEGTIDLVPNHFSEAPMILRRSTKCTVVVAACSPPDQHGYFSLGTNADYVAGLIGRVPIFLEATPRYALNCTNAKPGLQVRRGRYKPEGPGGGAALRGQRHRPCHRPRWSPNGSPMGPRCRLASGRSLPQYS